MPLERFEPEREGGPLGALWELLFPSRCVGCDRRGIILCERCGPNLAWLPAAVCPRCAERSADGRLCRACQRGALPNLHATRAACEYQGAIRTAIHRLKFRHARYLAPFLARVLAEPLRPRPLDADVVVPVPLGPSRRRERGYNQSELVAAALAAISALPAPTPSALDKPRDTPPQVGLSAAERRRNLRGAFACPKPELVAGRRCLLIDDVMTTGATLEACAETLKRAGAARVMALVVARD